MSKVIVMGTGTMGVGIAAGFLACGAKTIVLGRDEEKAKSIFASIEACSDAIDPLWRSKSGQLFAGSIADWTDWTDCACCLSPCEQGRSARRPSDENRPHESLEFL